MALLSRNYTVDLADLPSPDTYPGYSGPPGEPVVHKFPAYHQKEAGRLPFVKPVYFEQDIIITVRDGIRLRGDVFRPVESDDTPIPALLCYSPFGKSNMGGMGYDNLPGRAGVARSKVSGYESFESPDPATWTALGYAVVNVNSRGAWDSEGEIRIMGTAEGQDCADCIGFIAAQPWSNGSVGMVGNSWLAVNQYFAAQEKPPALKCIAPFEAQSETFRETLNRGGIPTTAMVRFIIGGFYGRGKIEDMKTMVEKYPLMHHYWEDKKAKLDQIEIPSFIAASYSTGIHTEGSFRALEEIKGPKWFRLHPTQEWHDLYLEDTTRELKLFFDRYLKNIDNGWEKTPKIRVSVLRFNQPPLDQLTFPSYPPPGTQYETFYLSTSGTLTATKPDEPGSLTYQSDVQAFQRDDDPEELVFRHVFTSPRQLIGRARAKIYLSCPDHDDMDVFIILRKADRYGNMLKQVNIPVADLVDLPEDKIPDIMFLKHLGPTGMLRASYRELDPSSTEINPKIAYKRRLPVVPGDVVELTVPIWPAGIGFEEGEQLVVKISGHEMRLAEFEQLQGLFESGNKGTHELYLGKKGYWSQVILPMVDLDLTHVARTKRI
ncbi:alpha/beta-hydrolase [Corynespora cassiicola Philippines]|uniref:Alpha/beta-hydrolase n=1 Tax=Corynespora cassiicola Philippines TaxID=1448308 RepID=A0A2T2NQ88_CORCC|nr:alpha/beta-hydrolase [Corynespora cassiicola Philippines]